jgi:hypothetical protein
LAIDWLTTLYCYDLKIREALEIKKHNCGLGHGLNKDWGAYVKTTVWNPVMISYLNRGGGNFLDFVFSPSPSLF